MADNRILAEIMRSGGNRLLNRAIDKVLPVTVAAESGAADVPAKKTMLGRIAGAAALRLATRSVPGAIVIGGSLIAKRLYEQRHAKRAAGKDSAQT
ncbi:MAG: hypothetical protein RIQ99_1735 [Pseudomonadota bacterium]|jgi:hypothetical protein